MNASSDSAGLLAFRRRDSGPEFLLVHPGGPFWRGKEEHAWSFPKGRIEAGETPLAAARREFREETGLLVDGDLIELVPARRPGRGHVYCWLVEADLDLSSARSNSFEIKGHSAKSVAFAEIDAFAYCAPELALRRIHLSLRPILEDALRRLGPANPGESLHRRG